MSDAGSPAGSAAGHSQHEDDPIANTHQDGGDDGHESDKDSDLLSEIDEDQFEDYDPTTDKPIEIDENAVKALKPAKRKRADGETTKKPKEGRRPKKRARASEEVDAIDEDLGERRPRKARTEGERRPVQKDPAQAQRESEEHLSPEERRRRALDRAIDAAVKNPVKRRRKKDEIDLEEEIDEQIANLKVAMEKACVADNEAREKGEPAVHKLNLLPQVTALLNRTGIQDSVLDPETNFLQSVKYFLEPLNDGSLPAYSIQRDIFEALIRLPIGKDSLLSSGIGKVVLFYNKSKRPEVSIKRTAERLLGEWSRPILKRTDDYKKRHVEVRDFDVAAAKLSQRQEATVSGSQMTLTQRPAGKSKYELERERLLAPDPVNSNRAQRLGLPASYSIAPRSTFDGTRSSDHRPIGSGGMEAFRKMTQKGKGKR